LSSPSEELMAESLAQRAARIVLPSAPKKEEIKFGSANTWENLSYDCLESTF